MSFRISLAVALAAVTMPVVSAATSTDLVAEAAPGDASERFFGAPGDEMGTSVDRDGDLHLVGGDGVASVVRRSGTTWVDEVALTVPGGNPSSFGGAVAIDMADDGQFGIAVVTSPLDSVQGTRSGSADVFEFAPGTGWVHVQTVEGEQAEDRLGTGVDVRLLDDDRTAHIAVGATRPAGVGYVVSWIRRAGTASPAEVITSSQITGDAQLFGVSVALDQDLMVVGAQRGDPNGDGKLPGSAAIFQGDPAAALAGGDSMAWVETHLLSQCGVAELLEAMPFCGTSTGEGFGFSLDIDLLTRVREPFDPMEGTGRDVIAVGMAFQSGPGGGDSGGIVVFSRAPGGDWELDQRLNHDDAGSTDQLGRSVRVDGRLIASTALLRNDGDGAVITFGYDGVDWVQTGEGTVSGDGPPVRLGTGLAIEGTSISAGAPFDELVATGQGSVSEYTVTLPWPDFPPFAEDDEYTTWATDDSLYTVWENDEDPELGQEVAISDIPVPASNGTATIEQGGYSIGYEPNPGFVGTDTFTYEISDGGLTATAEVTMTVIPAIGIVDLSVDESDGVAEVVVQSTAVFDESLSFEVTIVPGTATEGEDYIANTMTFAFEAGSAVADVLVPLVDDDVPEPTETFTVELGAIDGVQVILGSATVEILDTDTEPSDPGEIGPPFEAPADTGPTGGSIIDELQRIWTWIRGLVPEFPDLLPDRDEFGDFIFANWPPDLPEFPSFAWPDICAWLEQNFETDRCEIPGFERDAPSAVFDEITMQQGTTRVVNVAANDFDAAGRPIFPTARQLPDDERSLTGLTSANLDAFGNATIVAAADYQGVTSFPYEICTAMGHCATGIVNITVTADPPSPVARQDEISIWLGERRPGRPGTDDPVRDGVNLLANDEGTDLRVTRFNHPDLPGHLADLGTVDVVWGADGSVQVESTRSDPPLPGQSDLRVFPVPYEVCDPLNQCATSILEITKTGFGPRLVDDLITVGHRRSVEWPVLANDEDGVRIVSVSAGPGADTNLDPTQPPTHDGERIELHFSTHPSLGFWVKYRACRDGADPSSLTDCGEAYVIVDKLADRVGPTANDDEFTIGRFAHTSGSTLDVIGPEGGGADTSLQPVGFRIPTIGDGIVVSWIDVNGTPDNPADDIERPFARVRAFDQFTDVNQQLEVDADGSSPFRGLALWPLVVDVAGVPTLAPAPPAGSTGRFEYEICDIDLTAAEAQAASGGAPTLDQELCDKATVTLRFAEEPDLAVEGNRFNVGMVPDGSGGWIVPGSTFEMPTGPIELRHVVADTGVDVASNISVTHEIVDTPTVDPFTGAAISPERARTREVGGALVDGTGTVDPLAFAPTSDPIPLGADLYYRTNVSDDVLNGSGVSRANFVPVDFHAVIKLLQYELAVDGFDVEARLGDAWFTTPSGDDAVDWDPKVELRSVMGQPAVDGVTVFDGFEQYRVEVGANTFTGALDTIRVIPDLGFSGIVQVPYEACATWTPAADANPAFGAPYEVCRTSFVLFEVDAVPNWQLAPPGAQLQFPFDETTDPLLEFTIEESLGQVFVPGDGSDAASIGDDVFAEVAALFDTAGASFDATFFGDATLRLTAGVDSTGPYVDGSTMIIVEAAGAGDAELTQSLGGLDASVTAAVSVDGTLSVQLGAAGERFHIADLADLTSLDPVVDYELLIGAVAELDAGIVTATPYAASRVRAPLGVGGPDIDTTFVVPVRVEIPGSDNGAGEPIVVELEGRLEGDGVRITGSGEVPVGALLDGFGVSDISMNLLVDDTGTNGFITANIEVPALADSVTGAPSDIPVRIDIDGSVITGTATASVDGLAIGPDGEPFLTVTEGDVTVAVTGDTTSGDLDLDVSITATGLQLLPGNPLGSASIAAIGGTISSSGPSTLTFTNLTAGTADFSAITVSSGELTLGGDSDTPVLVLTNVTALDTGDVSVEIGRIEFYANGNVIVSDGCLASDVGLAETFGLAGILPFDVTSACLDDGVVTVEGFFDFSSMEDFPFTPTVTIGSQTVDADSDPSLAENRFTFSMDAATLQPLELGPIRIGVADLDIGGLTADGYIEIVGYRTQVIEGLVGLQGGNVVFDGTITGELAVSASGAVGELPLGADVDAAVSGQIFEDVDGNGVLQLAVDADVRGFIGEYVEVTAGIVRMNTELSVPYDPTAADADPISAVVDLESVDLSGVIRIPGLESTDDSDGIPVTLTYDEQSLTVTVGDGADYTAGPLTFVDATGSLVLSDLDATPTLVGDVTVGELSGTIGDVISFRTAAQLRFDADDSTPLLTLRDVSATIADPDAPDGPALAELTIASIDVDDDGSVSVGVIESTGLDRLADRFGFGQLLPFTLTGLRIDPSDLNAITTTVAGTFDFSQLETALPGDAAKVTATLGDGADGCDTLGITGGADDSFCFTIALDALGGGSITPVDFGPIRLELGGLDVGGVTGSTGFEIAGYTGGSFDGAFTGDVQVATDLAGALSGDFAADVTGTVDPRLDGSAMLTLNGTVDAALVIDGGSASASATFQLDVERSAAGVLTVTGPSIDELDIAACLELPGFASGPDCDGVFAEITKNGPIWTATIGGDGAGGDGVDVTVGAGAITVDGLTGTLTVDTTAPEDPIVTGTLDFDGATALFGGLVEFDVGASSFTFEPGEPLLAPVTITGSLYDGSGTAAADVLVAVEVIDLAIADDGTASISEIRATELDEAAAAIGVADLLPFVIGGLSVTFDGDDLTAPEAVTIRTAGTFDLSAIEDFEPYVELGEAGGNGDCDGLGVGAGAEADGTFCFGLRIDDSGVRPVDFGPIGLGLDRVEVGPFTFGGRIEVGGFDENGAYVPIPGSTTDVRGTLTAAVEIEDDDGQLVDGQAALVLEGDFGVDPEGRILLALDGSLTGGFGVADVIELRGATVEFGLDLRLDTRNGIELELLDGELGGIEADLLRVSVPGLFTVQACSPSFPLEEEILLRVPPIADGGGVGVHFGAPPSCDADPSDGVPGADDASDGSNPLDGWGGDIGGFEVAFDGTIGLLAGFGVDLTAGDAGFPEYLPIVVDEVGFAVGGDSISQRIADAGGNLPFDDIIDDLLLSGSMSIDGPDALPVEGSVDGLEIDIAKLRNWFTALANGETPANEDFFITNLDGLFFGVDQLEIGPVTVSGGLGIGVVPTDNGPKFWARVLGGFVFQGYGLGIDVLISEYGPLSVDVTVPGAMVLGQTGIVVAVTDAGASFNSAPPSICTKVVDGVFACDDGSPSPAAVAELAPGDELGDSDAIADAIEDLAASPDGPLPPLPSSFGVFIKGQISHLAIAAFIQGEVSLGLYFEIPPAPVGDQTLELPGVKLVGKGAVEFWGMSLGDLVLYADYADPLAPAWSVASSVANGGDLLDLLFPVGASQALTVDTEGLAAASILGVRELVLGLIDGGLNSPAMEELFAEPLDALIITMRNDPNSRLRQVLFGDVPDAAVTLDALRTRLLDVLPGPAAVDDTGKSEMALLLENAAADGEAALEQLALAVDVAGALFADLMTAVIDGETLVGADGSVTPLTPAQQAAKGQQVIDAFQEFLTNAPDLARRVGQVVFDVADPAVIAQAKIQFELLDVPVGEPALDATLVVNKEGFFASFDASLAKLTAAAATFVNAGGAVLIPLSLALNDQTSFQFAFPGRIDELLEGADGSVFDPRQGKWAAGLGSDIYFLGMQVSETDGLIVPGDSADQVEAWEISTGKTVPERRNGEPDGTVVRDALIADGGLYSTGTLRIPEMLADPIGWAADVGAAFDDVVDALDGDWLKLPGLIEAASTDFFATRPGGQYELFINPPTYDPDIGPPTEGDAWTWSADPYLDAEFGVDLLGYRVANGSMTSTEDGIVTSVEFPFLDGPLETRIESVVLQGQEVAAAAVEAGQAELSSLVRWPTIEIDQTITVADVRALLDSLGMDDPIPDSVSDASSLRIRGYSPLQHLTAADPDQVAIDDPIRARGGFEIVADVASDGFFDGGFRITFGLGTGGSFLPSLVELELTADQLDLGGVVLTDGRLLATYDAEAVPSVDIVVRGDVRIAALDQTIRFDGSLSDGFLTAAIFEPIEIGPLTITEPGTGAIGRLTGPDVTLRRVDTGFQLKLDGVVRIDGWTGSAVIDTVLPSSGLAEVEVTLSGFGRSGVTLDGEVGLSLDIGGLPGRPSTFVLDLDDGLLTIASIGLDEVAIEGRITQNGLESLSVSDFSFGFAPGVGVECADLSFAVGDRGTTISGSADLVVTGLTELVGLPGPIPSPKAAAAPGGGGCSSDGLGVTVDLSSSGFGSFTVDFPQGISIGGASIDLDAMSVERDASGVSLELGGSVRVIGQEMGLSSSASITIGADGLDGQISLTGIAPSLFTWSLFGTLFLDVSPDETRFGLSGSIKPPFTNGSLSVGPDTWIGQGANPNFSIQVSADGFEFANDALAIDGDLSIVRLGGAMTLQVRNARLDVPGLEELRLPTIGAGASTLQLSGDGTFLIEDLVIDQIGTPELRLVGARLDAERDANGQIDFDLHSGVILGTALNQETISLPAIELSYDSAVSSGFSDRLTVPGLDLGAALTTSALTIDVGVSPTELELRQVGGLTASIVGSTLDVSGLLFRYRSAGNGSVVVDGTMSGNVSLLGRPLADLELDLSQEDEHLRLDVVSKVSVPMGLLAPLAPNGLTVDGWIRSDGQFELSGEWSASVAGVGSVDGSLTLRFDEDGPAFAFSGTGSAPLFGSGTAAGAVSSNNVLTVTLTRKSGSSTSRFTFQLPPGIRPAKQPTVPPPVFADLPDEITITAGPNDPALIEVKYLDVLNPNAPGADSVSCTPENESLFVVGETTTVTCTASGDGGIDYISFDVIVEREPPDFVYLIGFPIGGGSGSGSGSGGSSGPQVGDPIERTQTGQPVFSLGSSSSISGTADPFTAGRIRLHSETIDLGEFVADENGRWEVTFEIPADFELGEHTLVVDRMVDGGRQLDHVSVMVVEPPLVPTGSLPATGSSSSSQLPIAALLLAAGLVLLLVGRRRRVAT